MQLLTTKETWSLNSLLTKCALERNAAFRMGIFECFFKRNLLGHGYGAEPCFHQR